MAAARALVAADLTRADSWRTLSAALADAGREATSDRALAPVVVLGQADAAEQRRVRARATEIDPVDVRFDRAALRAAGGEPRDTLMAERLLDALHELAPRVCPDDVARLGLGYCEQLRPQSRHPLRAAVDAVAAAFGLEDLEVYVARDPSAPVSPALSGAPGVIVPSSVLDWSPAERRFRLGAALAMVARRVDLVELVPPERLGALLVAAGRLALAEFCPPGHDPALVDEMARRLARALPRRSRRRVEDEARGFVRGGVVDVAAWQPRLRVSAARAGLLLANDLDAALRVVPRLQLSGIDLVRDLALFWVSDEAAELRRTVGIG